MTQIDTSHKWWVLVAMTTMMITLCFEMTAVNLAIAPISKDLHTGLATGQWILNALLLVCAVSIAVTGRLGDLQGHRKMFFIGGAIFIIASLIGGFAQNSASLIIARVLQGLGTAVIFPMIYAITYLIFPSKQRGIAIGIITAGNGFAQSLGPTIGGLLIGWLSWRWIFFINVPLTLLACGLLLSTKHETLTQNINNKIDYLGIALLTISLILIVMALNQMHVWGMTSSLFFTTLSVGIVLLLSFIKHQLHTKNPLLQIKLLAQRDFLLVNLARISHAFSYMSVLFLMGLLLQNVLGHPANVAGLILLYMTIPSGIFGPIAGKWSDRIGTRIPQILGMLALFIGCIFLTQIQHFPMSTMIALGLSLLGISAGLFLPCSSITAVSVVPKEQTGMATGVFYTNSFIGTTLGIAISGSILAISSTHYLLESIRTNKLVFTPQQLSVLKETASGIQPISAITQYFPQQMILELSQMTHQAFMTGFITAISTCAGLAAIGTFLVFMLKKSQNIQ